MLRTAARLSLPKQASRRAFTRGYAHGPELGPEEPLLKTSTIAWVAVGSVFFGLWYYDGLARESQSKLFGSRSVIGDKIDSLLSFMKPSETHKEKLERERWERVVDNAHESERHLVLFSPNRKPDAVHFNNMPVPEAPRRGVPIGRVITDLESIEPRSYKEEKFQSLPENYRTREKELQWEKFKKSE